MDPWWSDGLRHMSQPDGRAAAPYSPRPNVNGSLTPDAVTTSVSTRYSDWIETSTYNVNNAISISVDDFRVQNEDTEEMFYSIGGAIDEANLGDTLLIWAGTYRELVTINKELTLVGNGTSSTIINGSFQGDVVTVTADEVSIEHLPEGKNLVD